MTLKNPSIKRRVDEAYSLAKKSKFYYERDYSSTWKLLSEFSD